MRRKIPSTQALVCFEAAARQASFTKAAHELALTHSAVCRQVAALEAFLGVKLFRRTRRGIVLSDAGVQYARHVAIGLDLVERDTLSLMSRQGERGAIELAVVPTFATRWLLPRMARFRARHPQWTVHLETRTRPFMFAETEFDAALYAGTPQQVQNWSGTNALLLKPEALLPVCSPRLIAPRRRLTPAAIAKLPLLQQSTRPHVWRQWFEAMGVSDGYDLGGPRLELFSMLAMAAVHELGVALIPRLLIEEELARGELVVACDRPLDAGRAYYLIVPERRAAHPGVQWLHEWLVAEVASLPPP